MTRAETTMINLKEPVIVITGSTKGIGLGLAQKLGISGGKIVISSRNAQSVNEIQKKLHSSGIECSGTVCDVTIYEDIVSLRDFALKKYSRIDFWIHNAGYSVGSKPIENMSKEEIKHTADVNLTGTLYTLSILHNFFTKQGFGRLYLFEGFGSDGMIRNGLEVYGSTKRAVRYLAQAMTKKMKKIKTGSNRYLIGAISPGMVVTDLLMSDLEPYNDEQKKRSLKILRILADDVETVTSYISREILKKKPKTLISWLTFPKIFFRFLTAGFIRRNPFRGSKWEAYLD
jgi:short-subunit dehydrogenase